MTAAVALPDPDDRHVVAAAIRTRASLIVTDNLRDFPPEAISEFDLEAVGADDFVADVLDLAGPEAVAAIRRMRERFRRPEMTPEALVRRIEERGLIRTADILAAYRELL